MKNQYFLGIDVGSLSTDGVLIDKNYRIIDSIILPTGASVKKVIKKCYKVLFKNLNNNTSHLTSISTGYGRKRVDYAQDEITEITAHALGVKYLFPKTRTIIDIGGQDTKAISLSPEGNVVNFVMNDKCAAGTGRFLEVMARILEMDLEEMASAALEANKTISLSSTCTVFIESEIISCIADGITTDVIAASVFKSISYRILSMLKSIESSPPFTLTGGVAKNPAMVKFIKDLLCSEVHVPIEPQITGALGAALYGSRKSISKP